MWVIVTFLNWRIRSLFGAVLLLNKDSMLLQFAGVMVATNLPHT